MAAADRAPGSEDRDEEAAITPSPVAAARMPIASAALTRRYRVWRASAMRDFGGGACPPGRSSGGYHLPSEARHHPGGGRVSTAMDKRLESASPPDGDRSSIWIMLRNDSRGHQRCRGSTTDGSVDSPSGKWLAGSFTGPAWLIACQPQETGRGATSNR